MSRSGTGFAALPFVTDQASNSSRRHCNLLHATSRKSAAALTQLEAKRFVLDGEIAVPSGRGFSFDALLQRIHPAVSRVKRLAAETPAIYVVFDLLADEDGKSLLSNPLSQRRARLEKFASSQFKKDGSVYVSPATTKLVQAKKWLAQTGASLDGIIAKRRDLDYRSGERDGMQKIKNFRSADCVIGGFRYGSKTKVVGSLLLGLYGADGLLHHVGFTSGISAAERPALTKKLERLIAAPGFTGSAPGGASRWNQGKRDTWQPLKPELVIEVQYRPLHRKSLSAWNEADPLAAGQISRSMHDGPACPENVRPPKVTRFNAP